jgi:hypothetical protein
MWVINRADTLLPSQTKFYGLDLIDTFYPQLLVICSYASTGPVGGVQATVYPGFEISSGGSEEYSSNTPVVNSMVVTNSTSVISNATVYWAANGNQITDMVAPTLNSSSAQTIGTAFSLDAEEYPRFVLLSLTNTSSTYPVSIQIYGDR